MTGRLAAQVSNVLLVAIDLISFSVGGVCVSSQLFVPQGLNDSE